MKIENQVCALEQAKRLDELGIEQESLFKFYLVIENEDYVIKLGYWNESGDASESYAAYTVAELGVMLPCFFPSFIHEGHNHSHCTNYRVDTFPLVNGRTEFDNIPAHILNKELVPFQTGSTEAQARANMLIYLLENNLITAEEVNQRLSKTNLIL